jgi:hypothetical protein
VSLAWKAWVSLCHNWLRGLCWACLWTSQNIADRGAMYQRVPRVIEMCSSLLVLCSRNLSLKIELLYTGKFSTSLLITWNRLAASDWGVIKCLYSYSNM